MAQVLSEEGRIMFEIVNLVSICSIIGMFGIFSNIINMIVFYKQGFETTVNIGFFGLAISDITCLLTLQMGSVCMNPLLASSNIPWLPLEIYYLLIAWPHICFSKITSYITIYITAERYFSIAIPLKVKALITTKTTTLIMCLIYVVNLLILVPEYATSYIGWRFDPERNQTLVGVLFMGNRKHAEGVVSILHFIFGMSSFVGLVVFTTLLVIKLGQSSQWRKEVTSMNNNREAMSSRDKKAVKMIVLIASVLIGCYTPGALFSLTTFVGGPEFSIRGIYANVCEAMWTVAYIFHSVNSSVNIFIYYSMSTKYRDTFHQVFMFSRRNITA